MSEPDLPYRLPTPGGSGREALMALLVTALGASTVVTHLLAWSWGFPPVLGTPLATGADLRFAGVLLLAVSLPAAGWLVWRRVREPVTLVVVSLVLPAAFALASGYLYPPFEWLVWRNELARLAPGSPGDQALLEQVHHTALWSFGVALGLLGLRQALAQTSKGDSQGSARFATSREIARLGLKEKKTGIVVGGRTVWGEPSYYLAPDRRHVGIFGPSGCGKTSKVVIPTLLFETASMVVLDIKMELYATTAGYRREHMGHRVHAFAPSVDADWVSAYNPMLDIPKGPQEVAFAQALALALVDPDGKIQTPDFWQATSSSLLTAAILHTLYAGKEPSLAGVQACLAAPGRAVDQMLGAMLDTEHDPDLSQGWTSPTTGEHTKAHPVVALEASKLRGLAPETLTGIVATARASLSVFLDPIVAKNTREHSFSLVDLGNPARPTTLYLIVPARDLGRLSGLLRLFLQLLSFHLTGGLSTRVLPDGRLAPAAQTSRRLVLLLDELAAVGRLDLVARQIAYLRGYGIQVVVAVQTANQLYEVYGQHESVRGNLGYLLVFPSTEQKTAEEISRLLGDQTILLESRSRSSGESIFASRHSTSVRDHKRPLLTPDEVRRLGNDHPLLIATGAFPIANTLKGYFEVRELLARTEFPPPLPDKGDRPDVSAWDRPPAPRPAEDQPEVASTEEAKPEGEEGSRPAEPSGDSGQPKAAPPGPPEAMEEPEPDDSTKGPKEPSRGRPRPKR
ncbi:MAG TPA: type IV secretory system conjugative DNA transfer family protein [Thermoanaerobaculia bacterium]|nr:type IV secretory system conjugative DNA transfer family protein [Thermoanaerobaculia bacterium]